MKFVCFGDSNTYGYDPRSFFGDRYEAENRWVDILADQLHCTVINSGENGREVPYKAWQIADFNRMLEAEMPVDVLIVMLGTNDLLQGESVSQIVNRMDYFLSKIDLDVSRILLLAPPLLKLGAWVDAQEMVKASANVNIAYKQLAVKLGVQFVDTGAWNLSLAYDGVHLTPEGHRALANGLENYFRKGEKVCCKSE